MRFHYLAWFQLIVALLGVVQVSLGIDERSAEESPCLKITNAVDPDEKWFSSVQTWYYPLASRLDLYRCARDLLETDYETIPEYSLYYDSCLKWKIDASGYTLMGFNGKTRHLKTTPVSQGTADFKSEWSKDMIGRAYTTLTDNKTFIFTAACFADNQMSWNVFSTTKTLDEATKDKIYEHAESLGYSSDYFTELRYDSCQGRMPVEPKPDPEQRLKPTKLLSHVSELEKSRSKPAHGFYFCSACLRMCPNLEPTNEVAQRYFKKLEKTFNRE